MARAHFVKKARRAYKESDIKKGESYYWWAFRYGGMHRSKVAPKQSQLTQSEYLSTMYSFEEEIAELVADDTLQGSVEDIVSRLRDLASEQEDKLSNMPDGLQQGSTGELLQNRADACNEAADELEGIDFDEPEEGATDDEVEEHWQEKLDEVQGVSFNIE